MSSELKILKLFCMDRKEFNKGEPYLSELKNLERELKVVLNLIIRFYAQYDDRTSINVDEFKGFYDLNYPNSREREVYFEIVNDIYRLDINTDLMRDLLEQVIERHYASGIIMKLAPVVEGTAKGVLPIVGESVQNFIAQMRNPPTRTKSLEPARYDLRELIETEIRDKGLLWPAPKFNEILGGLKRATLGILFAYVDTGKTSLGMACTAGFANQLKEDEVCIYAGNEEASPRLALRLMQAFTNRTRREIAESPETTEQLGIERGFNRVLLFDSITHVRQLDSLMGEYHPRFVIVDQGTKLDTDRSGHNEVSDAQFLFNWYRERAKLFNTSILCLAQAMGETENRRYLKLSDIYGSRVAIQGELDYAIGVGRTLDDLAYTNIRFISVPKNKLKDGESGKFNLEFIRERCQFKEV